MIQHTRFGYNLRFRIKNHKPDVLVSEQPPSDVLTLEQLIAENMQRWLGTSKLGAKINYSPETNNYEVITQGIRRKGKMDQLKALNKLQLAFLSYARFDAAVKGVADYLLNTIQKLKRSSQPIGKDAILTIDLNLEPKRVDSDNQAVTKSRKPKRRRHYNPNIPRCFKPGNSKGYYYSDKHSPIWPDKESKEHWVC